MKRLHIDWQAATAPAQGPLCRCATSTQSLLWAMPELVAPLMRAARSAKMKSTKK
ncbi:MAG: hypothetical protein U1D25_12995 [Hydrogenophaga sp.]|uniref:hypothetical protein n=1 Tax=Hydrogenophaga sp. TaxID=1904254 RepID=UPI002756FEB7|nr:hypothetical protein [Hydrogenophaga sp.]MDP2417840.1 hypothetical protein [Hydrogenophaga sp.]MDZ4189008.1 hypothetical protein [Hydrogenophaga sp.]